MKCEKCMKEFDETQEGSTIKIKETGICDSCIMGAMNEEKKVEEKTTIEEKLFYAEEAEKEMVALNIECKHMIEKLEAEKKELLEVVKLLRHCIVNDHKGAGISIANNVLVDYNETKQPDNIEKKIQDRQFSKERGIGKFRV
jgi:hypothetical protein